MNASRSTTSDIGRQGAWAVLLFALIALVWTEVQYWDRALQDDTWISMIYSRNLVRGAGLVYNAGEPPVEGYTNFLWTVMGAGLMKLGYTTAAAMQVLGGFFSLVLLPLVYGVARRLRAAPVLAAMGVLLIASRRALALEAVGGLETIFFATLITAAVWLRLGESDGRSARAGSGILLGLAALTRPEGVFVFGLIELRDLALAARSRAWGEWLRSGLVRWLPFLGLLLPHLTFRYLTYGDFVPNTFHAKVSGGATDFSFGLSYVRQGLVYFGPVAAALPLLALWWRRADRRYWLVAYIVAVYLTYVAVVGGDFKPSSRFLLPVLPMLAALASAAMQTLVERLPERQRAAGVNVGAGVLGLLLVVSGVRELQLHLTWDDRAARLRELEAAGRFLNRAMPENGWLAICNAGAIPYFADRRTIDMLGLNDRHIGTLEVKANESGIIGHRKGDGTYVLDREPDVILFMRTEVGPPLDQSPDPFGAMEPLLFGTSEREIFVDPRFRKHYRLRSDLLGPEIGYLNWFQRIPERGRR